MFRFRSIASSLGCSKIIYRSQYLPIPKFGIRSASSQSEGREQIATTEPKGETTNSSSSQSLSSSTKKRLSVSNPPYQKSWDLPQISDTGSVIDKDLQRITTVANRVGALIDGRPKVPPNWRSDKTLEPWKRQMFALKEKLHNEGWKPKKRLSRAAMEGIRKLRDFEPTLTTRDIAKEFKVSPESIRRILKSKWRPTEEELVDISERWQKRGEKLRSLKLSSQPVLSSYSLKKSHQSRKLRRTTTNQKSSGDIGDEFF
ncbi:Rrg9p [Sugiyamaella lignohabitans]|uniref:Required for respiratory growth protein 9, mitochondrial n=1 Tax=Sugiyamaella lignohabitans TaxID=796027 RepID=A0A167FR03_9ASCO|nr:Rrg9p [Sugiyamaella lignohabitans]ANB15588.1 Rrg9p [Sugiyamaella lignohabitans]